MSLQFHHEPVKDEAGQVKQPVVMQVLSEYMLGTWPVGLGLEGLGDAVLPSSAQNRASRLAASSRKVLDPEADKAKQAQVRPFLHFCFVSVF